MDINPLRFSRILDLFRNLGNFWINLLDSQIKKTLESGAVKQGGVEILSQIGFWESITRRRRGFAVIGTVGDAAVEDLRGKRQVNTPLRQ